MINESHGYRILFIASGAGFCSESISLYHLLSYLDREKFKPLVAFYFYNTGPATEKIRGLGIPVLFVNENREPSNYVPIKFLLGRSDFKWLHEIKALLRFFLRLIVIEIPQLWRLLRILKKKEISLIVLNNDIYYHRVGALAARMARIPCICKKTEDIVKGRRTKRLLAKCVNLFIAAESVDIEMNTRRLEALFNEYALKSV